MTNDKKYCAMPFKWATFLQSGEQIICNPTWNNHPKLSGDTVKEKFNSPEIKKIRESILDDSYSLCSDTCPYLQTYREGGSPRVFVDKEMLVEVDYPTHIELCEDNVCNLACPTCRHDFILESTQQKNSFENVKKFSDKIQYLGTTTSGDPLYSKETFNFVKNISKEKFSQLHTIRMHTNGLLLMQKWEEMKHVAEDFNLDLNISVDAANAETYKVVRRGGNFDLLLRNLEFINTKSLFSLTIWFCVHDLNYKEMKDCFDLMEKTLSNHTVKYHFFNVEYWSQENDLFLKQKVDIDTHPLYNDYKKVTQDFLSHVDDAIEQGRFIHNL